MAKKKPAEKLPDEQPVETTEQPKTVRKKRPERPAVTVDANGLFPRTKFEVFEPQRVNRSGLTQAEYNPRVIDDYTRKRLEESLKGGMFKPVTWNKRTGNIVGGHQRLAALDDLHGGQDYSLTVAVVDVDEKTEREYNIRDNNEALMGQWDPEKLGENIKFLSEFDADFSPETIGFEQIHLEAIGVDLDVLGLPEESDAGLKAIAAAEEVVAMKALRGEHKKKDRAREALESGGELSIRFKNLEEMGKVLVRLGYQADQDVIVPGWRLLKALLIDEDGTHELLIELARKGNNTPAGVLRQLIKEAADAAGVDGGVAEEPAQS